MTVATGTRTGPRPEAETGLPDDVPGRFSGRAGPPLPDIDAAVTEMLGRSGSSTSASLVIDGLEAFALRAATARAAVRTLDLQYYAWHADVTGILLTREVLAAADRGVAVRLLLDDSYALETERPLAALDSHPGVEIRLFNATRNWRFLGRAGFAVEFALGGWHLNHRMHNKAWIADGRAVLAGGRNIGDEYFAASGGFNFRDMDLLLVGAGARQACDIFDRYWNHRLSRPITELHAAVPPGDLQRVREVLAEAPGRPGARPYLDRLAQSPAVARMVRGSGAMLPADCVQVLADAPDKADAEKEDPDRTAGGLAAAVVKVLHGAEREALIISPYFVPGRRGLALLRSMRARGVRISVVTNSLAATDVVAVHGGYARYRRRLLRMGIELWELKRVGRTEAGVFGSSGASLHTKAFAVDGETLFVGSFNLDPRSARLNTEMGAFARQPELVAQVKEEHARLADPTRSYRVEMDKGILVWTDTENDKARHRRREPDAGVGRRIMALLTRYLPFESQL